MVAVQLAHDMNVLARFLGRRDVPTLTRDALQGRYGFAQADVMALFGGSILAGGDVLAAAMRADVAKAYVIVGGAGHTTQTFRERVRGLCPDLDFEDDACEADLLERRSTNCGNNIGYLRELLDERGVPCRSLILSQDATMQLRMEAIARHDWPEVLPVSYATYATHVVARGTDRMSEAADPLACLDFEEEPLGMWGLRRYLTLLMGELPRLTDDEGGYGPRGRDFLVHVDVPTEVQEAFGRLREEFPDCVRVANPKFA